jgi:hypothetical protein
MKQCLPITEKAKAKPEKAAPSGKVTIDAAGKIPGDFVNTGVKAK